MLQKIACILYPFYLHYILSIGQIRGLLMKKLILVSAVMSAVLAGCTTQSSSVKTPSKAMTPTSQHFVCENGLDVHVNYLNSEQIDLLAGSDRATLNRDVSASGERYTTQTGLFGYGGEWHEKNGEAIFSFKNMNGIHVDVVCNAES